MPTPMIHLAAGFGLAERWPKYRSEPSFYLGLISPDAIHMREGWTRPDKRRSHFIESRFDGLSEEQLFEPIRPFIAAHGPRDEAYVAGYVAHLITDYLWMDRYLPRLPALYDEAGHVRSAELYNDLDQADIALYLRLPQRPAIWAMLADAQPIDLPGLVSPDEADRWRVHVLQWFHAALLDMGRYRPAEVLTYDFAKTFVDEAGAELPRLMRACAAW